MSTHTIHLLVTVRVDIEDADVVTRVVEDHDDWRGTYYDMRTEEDVLEHLAYNCVANGRRDVTRLDGWADLPDTAARMEIMDVEPA